MSLNEFISNGYQILKELGHNLSGGRVTYKAIHLPSNETVVIKQFQFLGRSWKDTDYDAYEQELQLLQRLSHPGIPRYLESFETEQGLCLVQEYINAESLAILRHWKLEEIKQIALSVLDILMYLQSQTPAIIHRDIKPENILVDEQLKVYLIDFGFARVGGGEIGVSSVVKGTMGFMPPEQLFNRQLTTASDLYGLGTTLICLLTGVKSVDIGNLVDENYKFHFRHLIPPMERGWISWLEKMVEPIVKERYQSAKEAFKTLKYINVHQLPKVRLNQTEIELEATTFEEKLTHTITITNPIPNTILSGRWEVAPHPSDPPHTPYDHSWISFYAQKFEGNQVECQISFDTSQLVASSHYQRQLILHTNSSPETYTIPLNLKTSPVPPLQTINFVSLNTLMFLIIFSVLSFEAILKATGNFEQVVFYLILFLLSGIISELIAIDIIATKSKYSLKKFPLGVIVLTVFIWLFTSFMCLAILDKTYLLIYELQRLAITIPIVILAAIIFNSMSGEIQMSVSPPEKNPKKTAIIFMILIIILIIVPAYLLFLGSRWEDIPLIIQSLLWLFVGIIYIFSMSILVIKNIIEYLIARQTEINIHGKEATNIVLITIGLAISLGAGIKLLLKTQFLTDVIITAALGAGIGILSMVLIILGYLWYKYVIANPRKHNKRIMEYQKSREQLIQP